MAAILVFIVEVAIAAFVHDALVRPYLGDSLAVVLVYLAMRAVTPLDIGWSAAIALVIACAIELGQWFHFADRIGFHDRLLRVILGTGFDPADFVAYAGGAAATLLAETKLQRRRRGLRGVGASR